MVSSRLRALGGSEARHGALDAEVLGKARVRVFRIEARHRLPTGELAGTRNSHHVLVELTALVRERRNHHLGAVVTEHLQMVVADVVDARNRIPLHSEVGHPTNASHLDQCFHVDFHKSPCEKNCFEVEFVNLPLSFGIILQYKIIVKGFLSPI